MNDIIDQAIEFAKERFKNDSSGHDFYHTMRVRQTALRIAASEPADLELLQLTALLHDVDDVKLFGGSVGQSEAARQFLTGHNYPSEKIDRICHDILRISFKGSGSEIPDTPEGRIVQDADRLDAMGAIGIARAFAFGGSRHRPIYIPVSAPQKYSIDFSIPFSQTASDQRKQDPALSAEALTGGQVPCAGSIDHFYEKLLLLKDLMNTETGRHLAQERHRFMQEFLKEFFAEWNGRI